MKEARPFQSATVETVFQKLAAGIRSLLICYATGLGKTFTAALIINRIPGRVLWITHTEELIDQSARAILSEEYDGYYDSLIEKHGGVIPALEHQEKSGMFIQPNEMGFTDAIGVIKQSRMDMNAKLVVASIQTLWRRLDKIPFDHFDLIVVDEAHLCMAKTWVKALSHFTAAKIGLTATPKRLDGQSLANIFEEIVDEKDIKFGIDNGYLCELDAIRLKTDLNLDKVSTKNGEFNESELEKIVDTPKRNKFIVESWKKYAPGRQSLFACVTVQHAMNLSATFNEAGINATFVAADEKLCPNRKERLSLWRSGEITVMCHIMILTAGFDYPDISCIGMARPTKSLVVYLQNIGRGTRLKPGQFKDCIILDIVDATSRHQLVNAWELDKEKPIEERVFVNKEKKQKLLFEKERRSKVDNLVKTTKRVDLFKIPKVKRIESVRMQEPATEAQLVWVADLGYDIVNNEYTKAHCADIISASPASDKAKNWLRYKGYDVPESLSYGEYQAAKNEIDAREANALPESVKKKIPFHDIK